MNFFYYIVNLETKEVSGTNALDEAAEFEKTGEYAVINREGWQMLWNKNIETMEPIDILPIAFEDDDYDDYDDEED